MSLHIFDRVNDCRTPNCWIIKDPKETNQVIWLREKEYYHLKPEERKGRLVLIKRLLYLLEYGDSPTKHIRNYCGEKYCVNPAHCYVPGAKRDLATLNSQIENHTLSINNARDWGLFNHE
jgi:hypothetical protein